VELLAKRVTRLRAQLAADEAVLTGLRDRGLARLNVLDIGYAQAQRRSELAWACEVATELRSGALPWAAGFGPTTEEDT